MDRITTIRRHWIRTYGRIGVIMVIAGLGISRLRFDADVLGLLPGDLPVVEGLRLHRRHFGHAQQLWIVIRTDDPESTATAARAVAEQVGRLPSVAEARWQPPWKEDPGSVAEFLAWTWLQQPTEKVRALADRLNSPQWEGQLRESKNRLGASLSPMDFSRLGYDPLQLSEVSDSTITESDSGDALFESDDGLERIVVVEPRATLEGYKAEVAWLKSIRTAVTDLQSSHPIVGEAKVEWTGGPAIASEAATGMEGDMTRSAGGTLVIISILFWLGHRSWRPMILIAAALLATLGISFGLAGWILGKINLISLGFAAIVLGLVVDYGLIAFQESVESPGESVQQIRARIGPGVFWSASTTAGAFLSLYFGGLPGLAQLGILVGIGVGVGTLVMLFGFLPASRSVTKTETSPVAQHPKVNPSWLRMGGVATAAVFFLSLAMIGLPPVDHSRASLKPRISPAYDTMERLQAGKLDGLSRLFLVIEGNSAQAVGETLTRARNQLEESRRQGSVVSFMLPDSWWPNPAAHSNNAAILSSLARSLPQFERIVLATGFSSNALSLTRQVMKHWENGATRFAVDVPTSPVSRWVTRQSMVHNESGWFALGMIQPGPDTKPSDWLKLPVPQNTRITGWPLLGEAVLFRVQNRLQWLLPGIGLFVVGCLIFAFRSCWETLLSLAALATAAAALLVFMRLFHWSWNLVNLTAIPLLLGTGVDYGIHVQLALRRHSGNVREMWRSIGKALLLCGGTTIVGFGSLAGASNLGLASLGQVCAVGILCVLVTSLLALPGWWILFAPPASTEKRIDALPSVQAPDPLYRSATWRWAMRLAKSIPKSLFDPVASGLASVYQWLNPKRVEIVRRNLEPVVGKSSAGMIARRNFAQFATKLSDLWRLETGVLDSDPFTELTGWEIMEKARASGRGILLVTIHLGNWEFGAPLLSQRGIPLMVLTLPEPGEGFTEVRQTARARQGVETVVVGQDPFAFIPVIRRLQDGGVVALLIDRPPSASAAEVQFFGRPFLASISAAELARASGCFVIPVVIPKIEKGYAAHILPVVEYERAKLDTRDARTRFTQEILRAFEGPLREHPDQWYHFVPVWDQPRAVTRPD